MVLKLEHASKSLEVLLRQKAGPHYRVSDSLGLGWGLIICISNKFTAVTEATGLEIILWEQSPLPPYFNTSLFWCGTFSRKVCWMLVYFTFYYGTFQIYAKIKSKIMNVTYHYLASTVIDSWSPLFYLYSPAPTPDNTHPPKWIILKQIQNISFHL